jgi:hypothetical protein
MIARDEILTRFSKWLDGQGRGQDEMFTMHALLRDLQTDFSMLFPEVDDEAEGIAILDLLVETITKPPRKPLSAREIKRRFERFMASKVVGAQFTIEEIAAAVFPDLDEAAAREEAYAIATNLGWEGAPWLQKAR